MSDLEQLLRSAGVTDPLPIEIVDASPRSVPCPTGCLRPWETCGVRSSPWRR